MTKKPLPPIAILDVQPALHTVDGQSFDIPFGGSIGLLALGDLGIIAWRQKVRKLKVELGARTLQNLAGGQ